MLKLAGEVIEGQLADHRVELDAHLAGLFQKLITGQYYLGGYVGGAHTTTALTAVRIHAYPFFVPRTITFDRAGLRVTTGSGGAGEKIRIGIYNDGTNLYPGSLIVDCGEIDIEVAAVKELTITGDVQLTKGLYWLAVHTEAACTVQSRAYGSLSPLGIRAIGGGAFSQENALYYKDTAYAIMADPFSSGATLGGITPINVGLRVKSLD